MDENEQRQKSMKRRLLCEQKSFAFLILTHSFEFFNVTVQM